MLVSIFQYREADLQKGESVCIDRCVAKYLDVHERIGKKLTDISMRDQDFQQRVAQGGQEWWWCIVTTKTMITLRQLVFKVFHEWIKMWFGDS